MGRGILTGEGGLLSKKAVRGISLCLPLIFPHGHGMMLDMLQKPGLFPKPSLNYVFIVFWSLTGDPIVWMGTILCLKAAVRSALSVLPLCAVP